MQIEQAREGLKEVNGAGANGTAPSGQVDARSDLLEAIKKGKPKWCMRKHLLCRTLGCALCLRDHVNCLIGNESYDSFKDSCVGPDETPLRAPKALILFLCRGTV